MSLSEHHSPSLSRRQFLHRAGQVGLAAGALHLQGPSLAHAKPSFAASKAEACIFLWLGGGACHIDTFDPKRRGDGGKKPGSYYDPIPTAIRGAQVCEHLKRFAPLLDRTILVRSLHHTVVDEHAAATNRLHTGRPTSGTIVYPSIGSVTANQLGSRDKGVPAYVVMGYPNLTRGPGFLGPKSGYIYLTETDIGPNGLVRPPDVSAKRQARREALLARVREGYLKRHQGEKVIEDYAAVSVEGLRLAGPRFMSVFDLKSEPARLRETYGGEFGQRCLLARRLVQAGVRFIEVSFNLNFVNGTGWDTHNAGQLKQHLLIQDLDQALRALFTDLEKKKLLDKTLVVVATEFGRPPQFDGGGGRGHHAQAFSGVLAGGGLRTGQVVGVTDDLGQTIVERPVSIPDFHATIYWAMGINPSKDLYAGERPVPITDGGKPIRELFA
jgi:hypothetical protein